MTWARFPTPEAPVGRGARHLSPSRFPTPEAPVGRRHLARPEPWLPSADGRGLEVLGVSLLGVSRVGWNLQAGPSPPEGVSPAAVALMPKAPLLPGPAAVASMPKAPLLPGRLKVRRTQIWRPPAAAGGAAFRGGACRVLERDLQAESVTAPRRAEKRGVLKASWHLQAEAVMS